MAGPVMFDRLNVHSDIADGIAVLGSHLLHDVHIEGRCLRPGNEEEALRTALPDVLPVGLLRRPGLAKHGQKFLADAG